MACTVGGIPFWSSPAICPNAGVVALAKFDAEPVAAEESNEP